LTAPGEVCYCHRESQWYLESAAKRRAFVPRSVRLVKLLDLLHAHAGIEGEALARACGISVRTLQRDLDALTAAGFPVYFDHGYRLAAPVLLPALMLTVDEALALRLAAQAATPRADPATARALELATAKLQQALLTKPPEEAPERQLALALATSGPREEALLTTLMTAITEQRTVKLAYVQTTRRESRPLVADPYRLLPSPEGWALIAYCHDRRRILRIPLAHLRDASVSRRRFRPVPARLLERHLHRSQAGPPKIEWVRILCRPPLVQALKRHPPVGALMWEDGPEGSVIFTVGTLGMDDFIPWLLACGDSVEVLEPAGLRHRIGKIARTIADRHSPGPLSSGGVILSGARGDRPSPEPTT
jgi:predicted DNA-binding transcriptional regulator YafY